MSEQEIPTRYRVQYERKPGEWGSVMGVPFDGIATREEAEKVLATLQWRSKPLSTRIIDYDRWAQYEDACRQHDADYEMSDDHRVWSEAPAKNARAKRLHDILVKEDAARADDIWKRLAH